MGKSYVIKGTYHRCTGSVELAQDKAIYTYLNMGRLDSLLYGLGQNSSRFYGIRDTGMV
jgi:hypothetical protein